MKNVEFKAQVSDWKPLEEKLQVLKPRFVGTDRQHDTYFRVETGRLKLREGSIETALIHYDRKNEANHKLSSIVLYEHLPNPALKQILAMHLEILCVVKKERKIYLLDHAKFHFDQVEGLGSFIEVEIIDREGSLSVDFLKARCDYYFEFFGLNKSELIANSYSDLLLNKSY